DPLPPAGRGLRGRGAGRRQPARALCASAARGHARSIGGALRWRQLPGRRGDRVHRRPRSRDRSRMSNSFDDRVLALAGLVQALAQVRRIADTGQSESRQVQAALDSVFRIDAADSEAVYGSAGNLRPGLRQLRDYLAEGNKDEALGKLALAVLQLE